MQLQTRKRIGLALSGGVARGPAHIGVLSVLERASVPIDLVVGVSAGALVGAAYCAGVSLEYLENLALKMRWWTIAAPSWPKFGLLTFSKLEKWLVKRLGDLDVDDLIIPFAAVATDMKTGAPLVLREGRLATAVRASCSVPGVTAPVEMDNRLLADGGVSNNLPSAAARAMGADYVIGVDLFQPTAEWGLGALGFGLTVIERFVQDSGGGRTGSDYVITPALAGASYFHFSKAAEMIEKGKQAAEASLPAIQAAIEAGVACD